MYYCAFNRFNKARLATPLSTNKKLIFQTVLAVDSLNRSIKRDRTTTGLDTAKPFHGENKKVVSATLEYKFD